MSESTLQPELTSLRSKLVDEITKDEKQSELLTKRIEKNKELLHAINGSLGAIVKEATGYGAVADTIRQAVKSIPAQRFTPDELERQILLLHPTVTVNKESVRQTLWNMVKRKEIQHIRKGTNRVPAQYEKIVRFKRTTEADAASTLAAHADRAA